MIQASMADDRGLLMDKGLLQRLESIKDAGLPIIPIRKESSIAASGSTFRRIYTAAHSGL